MQGTVKWYDGIKGYGFIQTDDGDIFVHRTGLKEPKSILDTGQYVEFDIEEGEKGPIAKNVVKIQ